MWSVGKRSFKQEANVYKILALADMDNGVPKIRFETEIKKQTELENYEVCEGQLGKEVDIDLEFKKQIDKL